MREFVQLREAWFNRVLKLDENNTENRTYDPKEANEEMKATYDQHTIGIILGKDYPVAPRCANDLGDRRPLRAHLDAWPVPGSLRDRSQARRRELRGQGTREDTFRRRP